MKNLEVKQKDDADIEICNALTTEIDEIWLWWAAGHKTNTPPAYMFRMQEHKYLDELLALFKPYSVGKVYADNNFAYEEEPRGAAGCRKKEHTAY